MGPTSSDNDAGDRAVDLLLQARAQIWNHCFSSANSRCLKCAVELGIPDAIHAHGGPMTLNLLVEAISVRPEKARCLHRVMRVLVHSGFFDVARVGGEHKEEEAYSLTNASKLLLKDNSLSLEPFVRDVVQPISTGLPDHLSVWLQNDDYSLLQTGHGMKSLWEMNARYPELWSSFDCAMASESRVVARVVVDRCKWAFQGLKSLVDVGGGTGEMGRAIADAFPHMECTVFDQPQVVAGLQGTDNLKYVGGDMFDKIPRADAILMKYVLHDWTDKESIDILKKCREAIPRRDGKLIIIEIVLNNPTAQDEKLTETQLCFDIRLMGTMGLERSEEEWAKLFTEAGFNGYKMSHVLGIQSLIEVYP